MKQVIHMLRQPALQRLGILGAIVVIIAWVLGLNPAQALAGFALTGEQVVFMSVSPISPIGTPTQTATLVPTKPANTPTPKPTNTPTPKPTNTLTPNPTNTPTPVIPTQTPTPTFTATSQPVPSQTPSPTATSPTPIATDPTSTPTLTSEPLPTETPGPIPTNTPIPGAILLSLTGPTTVAPGQTFNLSVVAQGVTEPGLYGVQFELNFDPALISVSNLQVNPDLPIVILNNADNTSGKIRLAAARQGNVPGLTGDVTLLTFSATAANTPGSATFTFGNYKIGNAQAVVMNTSAQNFTVLIQGDATPIPTGTSTPQPTETPTLPPTETPTPLPTNTPTPVPTETVTPGPTETPGPEPTQTPTPGPTETPQPTSATVVGQIILTGRVNNDWSGASATIDDSQQSATTDTGGAFSIANVSTGVHTSITADAPGYLPAVCTGPTITAPQTTLAKITLLSGDVNDDGQVNITDATTIGVFFGQTGSGLAADLNRDGQVDILDLILVTINFNQGQQVWSCVE